MMALKRYYIGLAVYIHASASTDCYLSVLLQQRQIAYNRLLTTRHIKQMATSAERWVDR